MRWGMNGTADYDAIAAGGAIEVVSTVQIRIFRGPGADIVHLDLRDRVASWNSSQFSAFQSVPIMRIGDITETVGQEVQTVSIDLGEFTFEIAPGFPVSLRDCAARKVLDGAQLMVDRWVSTPGWTAPPFDLLDFDGYIEQALPTEFGATLNCKAWVGKIAAASYPKHIVSPWCRHELGDAACGVAVTEIEAGPREGSTRTKILLWSLPGLLEVFAGGSLRIAAGVNTGFVRTVERVEQLGADSGGYLYALHLAPPGFPWDPDTTLPASIGLRRGCDKTYATCNTTFSNRTRFGGFPFVPAPESI
jgi:hypothetical protein